jgi:hypothetical protein
MAMDYAGLRLFVRARESQGADAQNQSNPSITTAWAGVKRCRLRRMQAALL